MTKASAEVVGNHALGIQDKSKNVLSNMIQRMGQIEELAKEE